MSVVYGFVEKREQQLLDELESDCRDFKSFMLANMRIKHIDDDVINNLELELISEDT